MVYGYITREGETVQCDFDRLVITCITGFCTCCSVSCLDVLCVNSQNILYLFWYHSIVFSAGRVANLFIQFLQESGVTGPGRPNN